MTFSEMLVRVGTLAQARGIDGLTWHWPLSGWRADAPNADRRWKVLAIGGNTILEMGQGHTGQEALAELLENLEEGT